MTPYLFGESSSPLFGCYAAPALDGAREHGVLLCAPIAQEYARTHWAMRQMALALAKAGFHVFRFDYSCAGDSAGDAADADVKRWIGDVELAGQELRDTAGVRTLSLVGLRFGACLAMSAAARLRARDLVLWDPVVYGKDYLAALRRTHEALLRDQVRYAFSLRQEIRGLLSPYLPSLRARRSRDDEILGFPFPPALCRAIEEIDLVALGPSLERGATSPRVVLLTSEERAEYIAVEQVLRGAGLKVEACRGGSPGRWDDAGEIENALLPADALRLISGALARPLR